MTNNSQEIAQPQEVDVADLDQVVGGAIMHDLTGDTTDARKQERDEKLVAEETRK